MSVEVERDVLQLHEKVCFEVPYAVLRRLDDREKFEVWLREQFERLVPVFLDVWDRSHGRP